MSAPARRMTDVPVAFRQMHPLFVGKFLVLMQPLFVYRQRVIL
jgi:hypothetical protein